MTDDVTPDDPFEQAVGRGLQDATAGIDGDGVTRAGVAAVVAHRRQHVRRRGVLAAAAVLALVVIGAGAAVAGRDDGTEQLHVGGATTSTSDPCAPPAPGSLIGWIDLTHPQVDLLVDAGLIDAAGADQVPGSRHHLTWAQFQALGAARHDPATANAALSGDQLWNLGMEDRTTGKIDPTRQAQPTGPIQLTPTQRWILAQHNPRSEPLPDMTRGAEVYLTWDQLQALRTYEAGLTTEQGDAILQGAFPGPLVPVPGYDPVDCSRRTGVATSTSTAPASSTVAPSVTASTSATTTSAPNPTTTPTTAPTGATVAPTTATTTTSVDPRRPAGAPASIQPQDVPAGQRVWAVYVDAWWMPGPTSAGGSTVTTTSADGHNELTQAEDRWWAAEGRASAIGYLTGIRNLRCDEGIDPTRWDPPVVDDRAGVELWGVPVYFATKAEAQEFRRILPGSEAGMDDVVLTCQP